MNKDYNNITVEQLELMKHAIGFSKNRVTGIKYRVMHAYRNYFCDCINETWESLVRLGLATRGEPSDMLRGSVYYRLTLEGLDFLGKLFGYKIVEID